MKHNFHSNDIYIRLGSNNIHANIQNSRVIVVHCFFISDCLSWTVLTLVPKRMRRFNETRLILFVLFFFSEDRETCLGRSCIIIFLKRDKKVKPCTFQILVESKPIGGHLKRQNVCMFSLPTSPFWQRR
jgi:hypothetical protein